MDILMPCLYSFVACVAYCIMIQISPTHILPAAIGGALCWLVYLLFSPINNSIVQSFLAGIFASIYAETLCYIRRVPVTLYLIPAIIPLVPGGRIYQAMEYCISGEMDAFINAALATFGIAGAIAVSILIASTIMKLVKTSLNKARSQRHKA